MTGGLIIFLVLSQPSKIKSDDYNFIVSDQELQLQQTKFEFNMKKYDLKLNWQKNIF